jgi:hypothetical protein
MAFMPKKWPIFGLKRPFLTPKRVSIAEKDNTMCREIGGSP